MKINLKGDRKEARRVQNQLPARRALPIPAHTQPVPRRLRQQDIGRDRVQSGRHPGLAHLHHQPARRAQTRGLAHLPLLVLEPMRLCRSHFPAAQAIRRHSQARVRLVQFLAMHELR